MKATPTPKAILTLLLASALTVCPRLYAEDPALPAPPRVIPMEAPKPPAPDRKGGQGAAQAMALAAAAMAGVSCTMMMREAANMPPGSQKTMMQMMAMQQCAQAAQNAANAAQNKEGKDKLAQGEPAKAGTLETQPFKAPELAKNEEFKKPELSESAEPTPPEVPEIAKADAGEFKPVGTESDNSQTLAGLDAPQTSVPNRIDRSKLGYDESGKSATEPTPERPLGLGSSIATGKGADTTTAKAATEVPSGFVPNNLEISSGKKKRADFDLASTTPIGGAGDSGASLPGESPLASMMALLGGGAEEGESKNGMDIASLDSATSTDESGKSLPNIFEYATYRYKKAAFEDKKLKGQGKKKPPARASLMGETTKFAQSQLSP